MNFGIECLFWGLNYGKILYIENENMFIYIHLQSNVKLKILKLVFLSSIKKKRLRVYKKKKRILKIKRSVKLTNVN